MQVKRFQLDGIVGARVSIKLITTSWWGKKKQIVFEIPIKQIKRKNSANRCLS